MNLYSRSTVREDSSFFGWAILPTLNLIVTRYLQDSLWELFPNHQNLKFVIWFVLCLWHYSSEQASSTKDSLLGECGRTHSCQHIFAILLLYHPLLSYFCAWNKHKYKHKNKSNKNSHTEVIAHSCLNDSPVEEGIRLKEICGYLPDTFGSSGGRLMEKGKGK